MQVLVLNGLDARSEAVTFLCGKICGVRQLFSATSILTRGRSTLIPWNLLHVVFRTDLAAIVLLGSSNYYKFNQIYAFSSTIKSAQRQSFGILGRSWYPYNRLHFVLRRHWHACHPKEAVKLSHGCFRSTQEDTVTLSCNKKNIEGSEKSTRFYRSSKSHFPPLLFYLRTSPMSVQTVPTSRAPAPTDTAPLFLSGGDGRASEECQRVDCASGLAAGLWTLGCWARGVGHVVLGTQNPPTV